MYLAVQYARAMAAGLSAPARSILEPVRVELQAAPSLCDALGHINNARYLDLIGVGRARWFARMGLGPSLLRGRYAFPIAGAAITYRREIPRWARFALETRLVEYDARWVCFLSSFELVQHGEVRVAARALTRGQLRKQDGSGSLPALLASLQREAEACRPLPADVIEQLKAQDLTVDVIRRQEGR